MKRKSTFITMFLLVLSFLFISSFRASAAEVEITAPNAQVETAAAGALLDVGIKLSKMPDRAKYEHNFREIAIALARLGRTESALKVTQWMLPESVEDTRSEVLRLSIRRSAILGDIARAPKLIAQIKNNRAKADAFLTVARVHLRRNEYDAAQKVLFNVTPLVPDNLNALIYTAYLFSESGNISVAKRLFERAEKKLPNMLESISKEQHTKILTSPAVSDRWFFEGYLLKANFVDEWQQFYKSTPQRHLFLEAGIVDQLIQLNQTDVAIMAARDTSFDNYPELKMRTFITIAEKIAPQYPDRALELLDEVAADWDAFSHTDNTLADIDSIKGELAISLSAAYWMIGKDTTAQEWLQRSLENVSPQQAATIKLGYALLPLSIHLNRNDKSTFSADQWSQVNKDVQKLLPLIGNDRGMRGILASFIDLQIKAGQKDDARANIEYLYTGVKQQLVSEQAILNADDLLPVAELFRKLGDTKRCDQLLQTILDNPQNTQHISKNERINMIIQMGFVDEGLRLFYSLPENKQKQPQVIFSELPSALAAAHPDQFPYELLKANAPGAEARNLSEFVRGLTDDLFNVPEENALVISVNGQSSSGS